MNTRPLPAAPLRKPVSLIGAPTDIGASVRGASMGPEALRVAQIVPVLGRDNLERGLAEGWVTRRGKRVVFCEVEVRTASAVKVAAGNLIYIVGSPPADGRGDATA